jgi:hypothetical protein
MAPIVLNLERKEILASALAGIPMVAHAIAASPAKHWSRALDAARRSYLQSAKNIGFAEAAADIWVSAVMFQLRMELKKAFAKPTLLDQRYDKTNSSDDPGRTSSALS